jgi:hypothetical protein
LQAKGKDQHKALLDDMCRWLGCTLGGTPVTALDRFPPEAAADFTTVMSALHAAPIWRRSGRAWRCSKSG